MKNRDFRSVIIIIITICLCCAFFGTLVSAADVIYINTDGSSVGNLKGLYAVGGSGNASMLEGGNVWAINAGGTVRIGGDAPVIREPVTPPRGTISVKTSVIKVGLDYYYSSARDSSVLYASLQNVVGNGYLFGFYDSNRNFFEVGRTSAGSVTVMTDQNVQVSAGTVGCFHVKLPGSYASFEEASAAAAAYYGGFPAYYNGTYYALVGNYSFRADAEAAIASGIPGEAYSASNRCVVVTKTGTTEVLFEFDCGSSFSLALRPVSEDGKAITRYKDNERYYGDFQFSRTNGENMTVVNILPLEDYVKGVVPYEMSSSWPLEALKAQALCARTYVMSNINSYAGCGFDVTDDTYSQAYCGVRNANAASDRAVDETAGLYVTYGGRLCETLYFSSDGGATEDSENIFASAIPYLRGIIDPYEEDIDFPNKSWSVQMSAQQIAQTLRNRGYSFSTLASITPEYSKVGNVIRLTFTDVDGRVVRVAKSSCYSVLGLKSVHYTVKESNGNYLFEGGGWGHNVGMSQWGAYSMASVHGYRFDQIIGFYYTGITISEGIAS